MVLPNTSESHQPLIVTHDSIAGYAIDVDGYQELHTDELMTWTALSHDQFFRDVMDVAPSKDAVVSAGFVYRVGRKISAQELTLAYQHEPLSALEKRMAQACDGWAVAMNVTRLAGSDSSVIGMCTSAFVTADDTPPHLFEVSLSYVGQDDLLHTESAYGSAAFSSPLAGVVWIARSLSRDGVDLEPGQIVFTGGVTSAVPLVAHGSYRAVSASLQLSVDFLTSERTSQSV